MADDLDTARAGQRTALFLAGTGIFWVVVTWAGGHFGWPPMVRAVCDLIALAGFGLSLWMTFQLWRSRQDDKGPKGR